MASIREVAKRAGVSIATVSRVINGNSSVAPHLRQQVLAAVSRCEYSPAVGLRTQRSIALAYVGPFTPGSPYDSACIDGMVEAMRATGFDLAVIDLSRDKARDESYRHFFARKGIAGAILRCTAAERATVEQIAAEELPVVVLGDHFERAGLPFVYANSFLASCEAMEHLLALGHERIAFAACEREDGDHRDRFEAYRSTLERRGLLHPELVGRIPPHRLDGARLIRNLMGMPQRPTAVFIADPLVAVGAIHEAHKMGIRVPKDLSIVGFDDTDVRSLVYPKMTAICQDSRMLGQIAFERVAALTAGPASADESNNSFAGHTAWLEIHETTGPPPESSMKVRTSRARRSTQSKGTRTVSSQS